MPDPILVKRKWRNLLLAGLGLLAAAGLANAVSVLTAEVPYGSRLPKHPPPVQIPSRPVVGNDPNVRFADVARQAGLHYRWAIPGPRPLDILQTIGNGCAFLDYDNDGNLDVLLVGADTWRSIKGDGRGHFTDVTHAMGLDKSARPLPGVRGGRLRQRRLRRRLRLAATGRACCCTTRAARASGT